MRDLTDLCGYWCMEPVRFQALWQRLSELPGPLAAAAMPGRTMDLVPGKGAKTVAVIRLVGTMAKGGGYGWANTTQVRQDVRAATRDPNISGILLAIDSPGGTVAGTASLADDVRAARKAKPVWAHIDDLGASAAYWVASQTGAVYANSPTALVGSIGTLQVVADFSQAAEKAGVKVHVFRTGPLKGTGAAGAPVTEAQAQYLQGMVDRVQQSFSVAVKSGRRLTDKKLEMASTGGVWLADEAQNLGLIDGVRPMDETLAALIKAN